MPVRAIRALAACVVVALGATVLVGDPFAAPPGAALKAKRSQAEHVLAQVNALDEQFGRTVEAWNGARYDLGIAERTLKADRVALQSAERQRRLAVARVEARLVGLYESSDQPTTISILFGSSTVSQMVSRFDAVRTVSDADHQLAVETTAARDRYAAAARAAAADRTAQSRCGEAARLPAPAHRLDARAAPAAPLVDPVADRDLEGAGGASAGNPRRAGPRAAGGGAGAGSARSGCARRSREAGGRTAAAAQQAAARQADGRTTSGPAG